MGAFAAVSGDHNPLHTDVPAARLAGFDGPIVHGMWLSAVAQRAAASVGATHHARPIRSWLTRWVSPLLPGAEVEITVERTGVIGGDMVVEVSCRADGELAMVASAVVAAPRTAYAFPGQGIQSQGMGLEARSRSAAARKVWDRADAHTREALGFSILAVVRDNPTELWADGELHRHPDGVLFLTQFTQVAMATLAVAQVAEMREAGVFVEGAITCGHSVGEYNALAAVTGILPLEALLEIVFRRGMAMHHLVARDAQGRSNYRLAAIRPSQAGLADDDVAGFVEELAERSGEFIQIVNYNLRGSQYAIAGTIAGLEVLEEAIEERRAAANGKPAFILVPGIDVPFHSSELHAGVDDFRQRLDDLLPEKIDPSLLIGRYIPNLVPRLFTLDRDVRRRGRRARRLSPAEAGPRGLGRLGGRPGPPRSCPADRAPRLAVRQPGALDRDPGPHVRFPRARWPRHRAVRRDRRRQRADAGQPGRADHQAPVVRRGRAADRELLT